MLFVSNTDLFYFYEFCVLNNAKKTRRNFASTKIKETIINNNNIEN